MQSLLNILAALFIVSATMRSGYGCTCVPSLPPLKEMKRTDAVFTGRVTKLKETTREFNANVVVAQSLKGDVHGTVVVATGKGGGDCGYFFEKGRSYLFYAERRSDGSLYTHICTRTQLLKDAHNEVLELEGRLPVLRGPEHAPTLELRGQIKDAGYNGFIILLRNNLHTRIFYLGYNCPDHVIQVQRGGVWIDYPPNYNIEPRSEIPEEKEASLLQETNKMYQQSVAEYSALYVDRLSAVPLFVAKPTVKLPWRVGVQYVSEAELDTGGRVQESKHIIWSAPIDEDTQAKSLSFNEAFTPERHTEK